ATGRGAATSLPAGGVSRSRQLTVIAISRAGDGTRAGVVSRAGVREDQVAGVVAAAERAAGESSPAEDAQPLLGPSDPEAFGVKEGPEPGQPGWDDEPGSTGIGAFAGFSPALGEALGAGAAGGRKLSGYAQPPPPSPSRGPPPGLRRRQARPRGRGAPTARAGGRGGSAWGGRATADFTDLDVTAITADLGRRL